MENFNALKDDTKLKGELPISQFYVKQTGSLPQILLVKYFQ